ncbi:hypothetical protein RIR_e35047_A0A2N1N4Y4_9GLOM [Rhizophagus irregularis DAOM 181602=DAOM 197198]|nr:hypothetical protein RIR_e35047_A0A2N1N4Y4_9GLOM [Rhizophagus irregularis DAOM 181602=DAOM 197198]
MDYGLKNKTILLTIKENCKNLFDEQIIRIWPQVQMVFRWSGKKVGHFRILLRRGHKNNGGKNIGWFVFIWFY